MRKLLLPVLLSVSLTLTVGGCGQEAPRTAVPETATPEPAPHTAVPDTATPEPTPVAPTLTPRASPGEEEQTMPFELASPAFAHETLIPIKYTCDGEDISPPLEWSEPPQGVQSFALICDDPDAPVGTWVHWVLYNLPADVRALPEALPPDPRLPDGSQHGENSWRRLGYGGPCPPGGTHRYYFRLYALDTLLDLEAGVGKEQLLKAMEGHILAQTELMGRYARP